MPVSSGWLLSSVIRGVRVDEPRTASSGFDVGPGQMSAASGRSVVRHGSPSLRAECRIRPSDHARPSATRLAGVALRAKLLEQRRRVREIPLTALHIVAHKRGAARAYERHAAVHLGLPRQQRAAARRNS